MKWVREGSRGGVKGEIGGTKREVVGVGGGVQEGYHCQIAAETKERKT